VIDVRVCVTLAYPVLPVKPRNGGGERGGKQLWRVLLLHILCVFMCDSLTILVLKIFLLAYNSCIGDFIVIFPYMFTMYLG
jgi:hypothetical protein